LDFKTQVHLQGAAQQALPLLLQEDLDREMLVEFTRAESAVPKARLYLLRYCNVKHAVQI
jgi:hypothetical protein